MILGMVINKNKNLSSMNKSILYFEHSLYKKTIFQIWRQQQTDASLMIKTGVLGTRSQVKSGWTREAFRALCLQVVYSHGGKNTVESWLSEVYGW